MPVCHVMLKNFRVLLGCATLACTVAHAARAPVVCCRGCPIVNVMPFGVFVTVLPGFNGLCHVSELDTQRSNAEDWARGDTIDVKCLEVRHARLLLLCTQAVCHTLTLTIRQLDQCLLKSITWRLHALCGMIY